MSCEVYSENLMQKQKHEGQIIESVTVANPCMTLSIMSPLILSFGITSA